MTIPLSLYIHIPWCIRKCPYCDFNSHEKRDDIPEAEYNSQCLADLAKDISLIGEKNLKSIFIGGGTPSVYSAEGMKTLIAGVRAQINFDENIEITCEANPGTLEQGRFKAFRKAGINRLSLGVQSFQDKFLKKLGRIHGGDEARAAITSAKEAGFENFNLDLMFGLPEQNIEEALEDLQEAISYQPTHISWYQLTLEPNTLFYKQRPTLPGDELIWEMQKAGQALLKKHDYAQYEISAYAKKGFQCQHNLNYWRFGDYLGIGAGAHSKLTLANNKIIRMVKHKHPKNYLGADDFIQEKKILDENDLIFEFMLNHLRLFEAIDLSDFEKLTGLARAAIEARIEQGVEKGLIKKENDKVLITELGSRFLNDTQGLFL